MSWELLQQVRLVDPSTAMDQVVDVLIQAGQIAAIAPGLTDYPLDTQITPCAGQVLAPGLVDLYSHSGEPGFEERETLASLYQAAIAGGFSQLTLLPDTTPVVDQPGQVHWLRDRWGALHDPNAPQIKLHLWGALTQQTQGEQLTELADLAAAGVVGWADSRAKAPVTLLRRLLEYCQPWPLPILLWPCDRGLVGSGVAREGTDAIRLGLPGDPAISETVAVASILECAAHWSTPVHLMRISTARSVDLIQQAKAQGVPVTASTTWLHLLHNTADLETYDPNLRLRPPLGTPRDQQALLAGLKSGALDAIAIDHTPYTYEEKTVAFGEAPAGAIGLELALPRLWQQLVEPGYVTAVELWQWLSLTPQHILGQSPTSIQVNQPLRGILFDPAAPWVVTPDTLQSRSQNTHWLGQSIAGRVVRHWA